MVTRNIKMVTRHGPCQRHRAPVGRVGMTVEGVKTQARPSASSVARADTSRARAWCNFKRRGES
jgi:hypothetical protein